MKIKITYGKLEKIYFSTKEEAIRKSKQLGQSPACFGREGKKFFVYK